MVIFLVDDSEAMRDRLVTLISELDDAVVIGQADNSSEAMEGIRRLSPEVVILDIQMPGGSGISLLKAIKQERSAPLVIMLTNHAYPQYREKCKKLGADFFLDKSQDYDCLHRILNNLVKRSSPQAIL